MEQGGVQTKRVQKTRGRARRYSARDSGEKNEKSAKRAKTDHGRRGRRPSLDLDACNGVTPYKEPFAVPAQKPVTGFEPTVSHTSQTPRAHRGPFGSDFEAAAAGHLLCDIHTEALTVGAFCQALSLMSPRTQIDLSVRRSDMPTRDTPSGGCARATLWDGMSPAWHVAAMLATLFPSIGERRRTRVYCLGRPIVGICTVPRVDDPLSHPSQRTNTAAVGGQPSAGAKPPLQNPAFHCKSGCTTGTSHLTSDGAPKRDEPRGTNRGAVRQKRTQYTVVPPTGAPTHTASMATPPGIVPPTQIDCRAPLACVILGPYDVSKRGAQLFDSREVASGTVLECVAHVLNTHGAHAAAGALAELCTVLGQREHPYHEPSPSASLLGWRRHTAMTPHASVPLGPTLVPLPITTSFKGAPARACGHDNGTATRTPGGNAAASGATTMYSTVLSFCDPNSRSGPFLVARESSGASFADACPAYPITVYAHRGRLYHYPQALRLCARFYGHTDVDRAFPVTTAVSPILGATVCVRQQRTESRANRSTNRSHPRGNDGAHHQDGRREHAGHVQDDDVYVDARWCPFFYTPHSTFRTSAA